MEKKSLGRGIEDITDIFLSKKKEDIPADYSTSEKVKEIVDESYPEHSFKESKGSMSFSEDDIIKAIDEKLKVTRNSFGTERPLENDLSGKDKDFRTNNIEDTLEDRPDVCEIIEHVTNKKQIGYINSPNVQQNLINSLFQRLHQNYDIKKIELVKVTEMSRPGVRNIIEENILIYIKEDENR